MSSGSDKWYVRTRGRVLGPFDRSQLASMRDRGQLSQDQEISQDRRSWIKAAELPAIDSRAEEAPAQQPAAADTEWPVFALADEPAAGVVAATGATGSTWYVARGDTQQGPLSVADLRGLINAKEIGPTSLVWKEGMPNWVPVSQVPELQRQPASGAAVGSSGGSSPISTAPPGSAPDALNQPPRMSGLAIASLVLGLIWPARIVIVLVIWVLAVASLVLGHFWLCAIGSILATTFGAIAVSQISRSNGSILGKGLALAGLILGIIGIVLTLASPFILPLLKSVL